MFDLRIAQMGDADKLFAWANDADTRAWSKSSAVIERSAHDNWMQLYVAQGYPAHLVLIADSDFGPVGTLRFDAAKNDVMSYYVSITVAPEHRGRRYGGAMLDLGCKMMPEVTLLADVKDGNAGSHAIFQKAGFSELSRRGQYTRYCREPIA